MGWCVVFEVDIQFKDEKDRDKINKLLEGTWLPPLSPKSIDCGLYCCGGDFDTHFPSEYDKPLIDIEPYVLEGSIYFRCDEEEQYWKIELNSDTNDKWVERTGYMIYEPIEKGRILNKEGE